MKKLVIVVVLCCFVLVGCAGIKYTAPTGEEFCYSRLGTQKISGFEMTKNEQGLISVKFESQEGTGGDVAETMKNISEVMVKTISKVP